MAHEKLDDIDRKLLEILQQNGRTKRNDLAEQVGLSIPSVSERLHKLEERGVIKGYTTILDTRALGRDITAFIIVTIDTSRHYPQFIHHAQETDEILECHAITGEGTHILKIRTENTATLEKLLSKIQTWAGVVGTRTSVVLSSGKETTRIKVSV
jgi:Lrp/AsnC family leucine-responsive transcriptional regulator